ncbi:MAG: ABC transporter permease [Azospirillaceae bacterium]
MTSAAVQAPARGPKLPVRVESLVVLAVMTAAMVVFAPNFLSVNNLLNILLATAVIGVLAVGATFVISSAGLDLSLGSVLALTGVCGAALVVRLGLPWPFGILGCIGAGMLVGAVNGSLVALAKLPPFIVTLGMLSAARGLGFVLSDGRPIYGLPAELVFLGQGRPFGVPMPVIVFLAAVVVGHFVLSRTRFGRYTLVVGDNEQAARVTGIHVERHKIWLYVLAGAMSGLAGLLFMTRINAADPTAGVMYELQAITAVVIGGTNLFGGRGTVIGTLIGALIMGILQNGLNLMAVQPFYQQISIGVILVLAVWLDRSRAKGQAA